MCVTVIPAIIVIHVQLQNPPALLHRLEIQAETIHLFFFIQW